MSTFHIKKMLVCLIIIVAAILSYQTGQAARVYLDEAGKPLKYETVSLDKYDQTGTIDTISKKEIVIDDVTYRLTSSAKFYVNNKPASRRNFKEGTYVAFKLNDNKEFREVVAVYIIDRPEE